MKKFLLALVVVVSAAGAADAAGAGGDACTLISGMMPVFNTLRTLAFIGAAFCIAGWAWGFISGGKAEMKDVKDKGIGLLVGFALLFGIGIVLQFLPGISGCAAIYGL